jgi:alcohol dehydrogenase
VTGDLEGTTYMMIASTMAGISFSHTRTAAVHGMVHTLGGYFDIRHGIANAILLPHVMKFNLEVCPEKYREISKAMSKNVEGLSLKDATKKSVEWVERLLIDLGLPTRLRDLGCDREKLHNLLRIR